MSQSALSEPVAKDDTSCGGFKSGGADCSGHLNSKGKKASEKKLATAYKSAMAALPQQDDLSGLPTRESVAALQKAWSRFHKEYCSLYGDFKGGAPSWKSAYSLECEEAAVIEQTKLLTEIHKCAQQGGGGGCVLPSLIYREEQ
jgi:uncharacterized protein YecT (DUF1311 family)